MNITLKRVKILTFDESFGSFLVEGMDGWNKSNS